MAVDIFLRGNNVKSRRGKVDLERLEEGDGGGRVREGRKKGNVIPHSSSTVCSHVCVI